MAADFHVEIPMTTATVDAVCTHSWQLPAPNGPTVLGICRNCGATRAFNNSFPEMERTNNSDLFGAPRRNSNRTGEVAGDGTTDYDLEVAIGSMRGLRAAR